MVQQINVYIQVERAFFFYCGRTIANLAAYTVVYSCTVSSDNDLPTRETKIAVTHLGLLV